jgi:hypothetical protein
MHLAVVSAGVIDLSPILTPLIQFVGLILMGLAGWAVKKLADLLHIAKDSALRQTMLDAVDRGISFAQNKATTMAAAGVTIPTNNAVAADAVNYVVSKFPDTLNGLGMTPQHVADVVLSKMPTQ